MANPNLRLNVEWWFSLVFRGHITLSHRDKVNANEKLTLEISLATHSDESNLNQKLYAFSRLCTPILFMECVWCCCFTECMCVFIFFYFLVYLVSFDSLYILLVEYQYLDVIDPLHFSVFREIVFRIRCDILKLSTNVFGMCSI